MNPGNDEKIEAVAEALLGKAGLSTVDVQCVPLAGGRNNRVYRADASGKSFLLKRYYRGGDWDRLAAESRFLLFCAEHGIECVPRLLAEDAVNGFALHSWIDGRPLGVDSISDSDIGNAAAFLRKLDEASRKSHLLQIPSARDAALCLEDFFRSPRERLEELHGALLAHPNRPMAEEALLFYEKELFPSWEKACQTASTKLEDENLHRLFAKSELLMSPSDVGFHNALRAGNGVTFLDFEYAGLDSRVKAAGDFLSQADYPISEDAVGLMSEPGIDRTLRAVLPLFRIKFCCIILNDFKKCDADRREFAMTEREAVRLRGQLCKAGKYLRRKKDYM